MQFNNASSEIYVPDQSAVDSALARTTHLAVGAHQDDIEFMAYHGILECFGKADRHFTSATVTNGSGSPRSGAYQNCTDEEMQKIRRQEQRKAAFIGDYSAHVFLDYASAVAKDKTNPKVVDDLQRLVHATKPEVIYTHNLADKHDTHVTTALRLIEALRLLPKEIRPQRLYGCEVWRALDWLNDDDKVVFNVEGRENIAVALTGVFDSQISGGKRYDLATIGRRHANATFLASHGVDASSSVIYAMDLTPLVDDVSISVSAYVRSFIERFENDVTARLAKLG